MLLNVAAATTMSRMTERDAVFHLETVRAVCGALLESSLKLGNNDNDDNEQAKLEQEGCALLKTLSERQEAVPCTVECGGIDAVLSVAKRRCDDVFTLCVACTMLTNVYLDKESCQQIVSQGGSVTREILRSSSSNEKEGQSCNDDNDDNDEREFSEESALLFLHRTVKTIELGDMTASATR